MSKNNQNKSNISFRQKAILVILGFFLTTIILEAGLRLGGFILLFLQENKNRTSFKQKDAFRIMCLGESTTQRQWPLFLEEILNQSNIGIKFSVIDKGIAGTNTSNILNGLEPNLNTYQPDMVITMMGINDQKGDVFYKSISDSKDINFFKSFRIYKLTNILWVHILTKLKEIEPYKLNKHTTGIKLSLKKTALKQLYTEDKNPSLNEESLKLKKTIGYDSINEESFKKAIELDPENVRAYRQLAWLYKGQGRFSEFEESFKKAIELNPKNGMGYAELARFYKEQGRFSESEKSFKKAIELDSENDMAYTQLAWFYKEQGRFSEPEESFKKAIELNPEDGRLYAELAWLYREQGRFSESEKLFKKAIEFDPKNEMGYVELAQFYREQNKLSLSEELLKKAIELNHKNGRVYAELEILYEEMGKPKLAREYSKKADEAGLNYYNPITIANYHKLKDILDKRGIVYVCVQYPMRPLKPLKRIFEGRKGIIFVDNNSLFRIALKNAKYKDYFRDIFGGNFGHCTPEGNKLLAGHIANVILKEVFGK